MSKTAAVKAARVPVVIIPTMRDGKCHVHAAGCADLTRKAIYKDYRDDLAGWVTEVADHREVVLDVYGPSAGGFFEEGGYDPSDPQTWKEFDIDFQTFPCLKGLPYDVTGQPAAKPAKAAAKPAGERKQASRAAAGDIVFSTRPRSTGTNTHVRKADEGYEVWCEAHNTTHAVAKRLDAEKDAAHPYLWCPKCASVRSAKADEVGARLAAAITTSVKGA
jgi:hypothetical protein